MLQAPVSLRRHEVLTEDVVPPSVQIPLPGQSYNPTHESHQALLSTANEAVQAQEASNQRTQAVKAQLDAARQARKGKELWELAQDEVAQAIDGDDAEVEQGDEHPDEVIEKKRSNSNKPKSAKDKKRRAHNINEQVRPSLSLSFVSYSHEPLTHTRRNRKKPKRTKSCARPRTSSCPTSPP